MQATIKVQEAARAVAVKNEKLLALLALHGVSHDEISAFLSATPTTPTTTPPPPRGVVPGPSMTIVGHIYGASGNGRLPWKTEEAAQAPRRCSMPVVPNPYYPRPAAAGTRRSADLLRSQANVPPPLLGAVHQGQDPNQSQALCQSQSRNQTQNSSPASFDVSVWGTPAPALCPESVSYTPPSASYSHEELGVVKTSRCGLRPGGGCGPQYVPCGPERAERGSCAHNSTLQQPVITAPLGLSGQMVTSCDMAAVIIAEACHHGDIAAARESLACGTEGPCSISNLDLLELMERHG